MALLKLLVSGSVSVFIAFLFTRKDSILAMSRSVVVPDLKISVMTGGEGT